jgi:hypothetical protein
VPLNIQKMKPCPNQSDSYYDARDKPPRDEELNTPRRDSLFGCHDYRGCSLSLVDLKKTSRLDTRFELPIEHPKWDFGVLR